jgi:hypothetical protein
MKLRPLLLTLAVLAPATALVWWLGRPAPATSTADPRVGQRLADPAALASATRVTVRSGGKTVELARAEGERWTLLGDPVLPADASRLTRLTSELLKPRIERVVSSSPTRLATFDLEGTGLAYTDASGGPVLDLDLGKTLEGGTRILRFGGEPLAYAARIDAWIDAEPASWRDTALVAGLQPADVASVRIGFSDTPVPVVVSRTGADQRWTSPSTPAGQQVKATLLTSQLGNLTNLRYTGVAPRLDPGVVAARIFPREIGLTTFSGRTLTLSFGRAPETPTPPAPEPKAGEEAPAPPPPAPRPVYLEFKDSIANPTLEAASRTHVFEVAESIFSGLPAKPDDLFEPVPEPPAAPTADGAPATTAEGGVSVVTPPLGIPSPTGDTTPEAPAATGDATAKP